METKIDLNTPLFKLTVGEFLELQNSITPAVVLKKEESEVFMNSKEVVECLKISKSTLNRWIKGYLKSDKLGGIRRFRKSDVDKLMNGNHE